MSVKHDGTHIYDASAPDVWQSVECDCCILLLCVFINKSGTFRARYLLNRTNYNNRINSPPPTHTPIYTHTYRYYQNLCWRLDGRGMCWRQSRDVVAVTGCVDSHEMCWRQSRDVMTVTGCDDGHWMWWRSRNAYHISAVIPPLLNE